jgi:16S rRNA (adenine1518-N6/adenine1519-N6)-dimethyltransferase
VLGRIVEAVAPRSTDDILEIGAGAGEMTFPLIEAGAGRVVAIESDAILFGRLDRAIRSRSTERVEAIHQDFLQLDLPAVLPERGMNQIRVVGNLPYSVAAPILLKLLTHREHLVDLTLLFQLEVAERLTARPRTKPYGSLTVVAQQAARVEILFTISPQAFRPRPKVHSALVRLEPRGREEPPVVDDRTFRALVKALFAHRRKNISNNLKHLTSPLLDVVSIRVGLEKLHIDPARRAESLSVEEFAELSHFCTSRQ